VRALVLGAPKVGIAMTYRKKNEIFSAQNRIPGRAKRIGVGMVFLWFLIGGIAHFTATHVEMSIVPPYIPWPRAAVLVSGVFELLGAAGILYRPTRRTAGVSLFTLTIAVTPVHIYMLQRPELFAVPYWVLVLRLPLQAALLALIAWSTIPAVSRADGLDVATCPQVIAAISLSGSRCAGFHPRLDRAFSPLNC
jgi:uncharacterized membrane protein